MRHRELKLLVTRDQEETLNQWLWHLTDVWNWGVKKIGNDARDGVYHSSYDFQNLLAGHGEKIGIPSHTLQGMLSQAYLAWKRCFGKLAKRPRLKGRRNQLSSIPFPDPIRAPLNRKIAVPGLGKIRFHAQDLPAGRIKCGRIVKRASGWYMSLFIDGDRDPIKRIANGAIGIDPGFSNLLTISTGEMIAHPRELEKLETRIAQAQRGGNKLLTSRLQERRVNRVRDRNHKLSLRLVQYNEFIAFSKDSHSAIAKTFGKSVSSSSHYQLRQMLAYKSRSGGTRYVEVEPAFSTMTCSSCGARSGPKGLDGLAVRTWICACGAQHNRDTNAALNILKSGLGYNLKEASNGLN